MPISGNVIALQGRANVADLYVVGDTLTRVAAGHDDAGVVDRAFPLRGSSWMMGVWAVCHNNVVQGVALLGLPAEAAA